MYVLRKYVFENSIEIEKLHTHRFHRKGQKRNEKTNPTPEKMQEYNKRKQTDYLRRLIKLNMSGGYHVVLTYDKNNRPDRALAKQQFKNFMDRIKYHLRKKGKEIKYITTTEYESKAIHHHVVINDIDGIISLIKKQWWHGIANFTPITDDVYTLAEYLIKETDKTFRKEDSVHGARYSRSRNLVEPTFEEKIIKADSFRKEPRVPNGYVLNRDTFVYGVSEVTGYEYQKYELKKITPEFNKKSRAMLKSLSISRKGAI